MFPAFILKEATMNFKLVYGNIAKMNVDCIVNASNGEGFMGGQRCIDALYPGVAESIQYISKGQVEKEAKANCKANNRFNCYAPGNVFITNAPGLSAKYVLHAVTMRFAGCKTKAKTIDKLIPKIFEEANKLNIHSLAIPLLGTGTGRLDKMYVYHKIISYDNILNPNSSNKDCNITIYIVCPDKKFFNTIGKESYSVDFINSNKQIK